MIKSNELREKRKNIFGDTMSRCTTNDYLRESIAKSISNQEIIYGADAFALKNQHQYEGDLKIIVSKKRSFEAASGYSGKKVCVHNFASATNPGGGVANGSSAQEECLCRCSTLYPCINEPSAKKAFHDSHRNALHKGKMSALYNDDCIYTPDVVVFKSDDDNPKILPESEWYSVDVITCAAPNLRSKPSNAMNPDSGDRVFIGDEELEALHAKRANRILDIAKEKGAEVVILGAFGCGAFQNPPNVVAKGIMEAVRQHIRDFEIIELAIYCPPGNNENFDVFYKEFGSIM